MDSAFVLLFRWPPVRPLVCPVYGAFACSSMAPRWVPGSSFVAQISPVSNDLHLLLQTTAKVLNDELDQMFQVWYPVFRRTDAKKEQKAA